MKRLDQWGQIMKKLEELQTVIGDMMHAISGGDHDERQTIPERLARIDALRIELGDQAPPMLRHYLEKRSYSKALEFLQGDDETKTPNC